MTPFALPRIHQAGEVDALQIPDHGATRLADLFEIADELRRRSAPGAIESANPAIQFKPASGGS